MKKLENLGLFITVLVLLFTVQFLPVLQVKQLKIEHPPRQTAEIDLRELDGETALRVWQSDMRIRDDIFVATALHAAQMDDESRKKISETNKACKQSLDLLRNEREERIAAQKRADDKQTELDAKEKRSVSKESKIFWISIFGISLIGVFRLLLPSDEARSINWKKAEKVFYGFELALAIAVLVANRIL